MSYPDPASTDWVPLWSAGPIAGYVPAARVYKVAAFSCPNTAFTSVPFDAERWDTDGMHDNVTNNTRLTIRTAGKYYFNGIAMFPSSTGGSHRLCFIRLNGTGLIGGNGNVASTFPAAGQPRVEVSATWDCVAGDYVELQVYQDTGGAANILADAGAGPELEAVYLGPNVALGAVMPVAYGTTLPVSPADGQEAILVDSVTNPTYQWRFRYNAGSSSAYKWEFVGGTWATAGIAGAVSTTTTYPTLVFLGGPAVTVPRAGEYQFQMSSTGTSSVAQNGAMINLASGAGGANDANLAWALTAVGSQYSMLARNGTLAITPAGPFTMVYAAYIGGTATFDRRTLSVQPIRVA